jgi:hypothetical protein
MKSSVFLDLKGNKEVAVFPNELTFMTQRVACDQVKEVAVGANMQTAR